jgi:hypothetical protein
MARAIRSNWLRWRCTCRLKQMLEDTREEGAAQSDGERSAMSDILKRILAVKRDEVATAQAIRPLAELRAAGRRSAGATRFPRQPCAAELPPDSRR